MKLISIKDKLPQIKGSSSDKVLLYDENLGFAIGYLYKESTSNEMVWQVLTNNIFDKMNYNNITHWMPLPDKPKGI